MPKSFNQFELTEDQRLRTMHFAMITTSCTVIAGWCVGGNVLTLICLKLGAGELFLGFLAFAAIIPFFCMAFSMSSVERVGKVRVLVSWYSIATVFLIPFLLLPILVEHFSARLCLWIILLATVLRNTVNSLGTAGWFPLLQDNVPQEITGRFFGKLRVVWQSAGVITAVIAAILLGNNPAWWKFEVLFGIAFAAYIVRGFSFLPMSERPPVGRGRRSPSILSRFMHVIADVRLRKLLIYICSYMFAAMIAEPFKIKLLKDLGYSEGFILAASTVTVGLGAIISLQFWGRLADRFGNRAVFSISHVGMMIAALMWIMMEKSPFGSVLVFVLYFWWSIFNSGNGIAQTRYILHAVPAHKQYYINVINIITNMVLATAPLFGGMFLVLMKNYRLESGGLNLNNYQILFILSAALFVVPHNLRRGLKLKKELPTTQVLAVVTRPLRGVVGPFIRFGRTASKK
ncbi:MAG: MFS transporter [Planctomycetota bacterium]